ncbi:MAG TPA: alpha/beta hydrolase, partial [Verrucomicrobiae bacterium]|nr:alpha/beta hydrolase [Verrucomicrobiae bacterium]
FFLPHDVQPTIPAGDKVILYLHGGGSRLEEAVALGNNLILQGRTQQPSVNYTVISLDLPNSAYGDRLDVATVVPAAYHPSRFHVLDFEEAYVIGFIDALKKQIPNLNIATVMGGSLGGNLTLRLARRDKAVFPYLMDLVPWSVTTMNPGHGDIGNAITWAEVLGRGPESPTTRADFFHALFYSSTDPVFQSLPPQPQMWWRSPWKNADGSVDCAQVHTSESRFDRYEIYSPAMRRWAASLNAEQAMYSFRDKDPGAGLPRLASVTSRILLASGQKDSYGSLNDIFNNTIKAVPEMINARGQLLLIKNTGHSIHDERPAFFARQIVQFLATEPAACAGLRNTIATLTAQIAAKQAELEADAQDQKDCQNGQGIYRGDSRNKPADCDAKTHQQTRTAITNELNKLDADLRAAQNQKAGLHCRE